MRRLFCEHIPAAGEHASLDASSLKHARVLRLRPGDEVGLFDGAGTLARATLSETGAQILTRERVPPSAQTTVLVLALAKGPAMDVVVRMSTELGIQQIRIVPSQRSVPAHADAARRLSRWEKIAREACRQSERLHETTLHLFESLSEAADAPASATRCVAWARGGVPVSSLDTAPECWLAIGPEGGFTEDELELFDRSGWARIVLSPTILRVDTAAVAAISTLMNRA